MTDNPPRRRRRRKVLELLLGPTGSVIIHVVVILVLVKLVVYKTSGHQAKIEVIIMDPETADLEELKKELEELKEIQIVDAMTPPDISIDTDALEEEVEDFDTPDPNVDFAALDVIDDIQSALVMRGLYKGRSEGGRRDALNKHARKWGQFTEAGVIRALQWLKENQKEDGSWGDSDQAAMTGLGLLTFLAHGETPTSEKFGLTVENAIRWLTENQKEDGNWNSTGSNHVYGQGIATYAVAEAYGLTQIPTLRTAMENGIQVVVSGQQPGGGWDYHYGQNPRRDTSVSGWQIQALKAAYIADPGLPGVKQALRKAVVDLKQAQGSSGRFDYAVSRGDGSIGMTGVGVLCLQLLGEANSDACRRGAKYLAEHKFDLNWDEGGGHSLYGWYYITQAKFHDGKDWKNWNNKFAKVFTEAQNSDGSWTAPGGEAAKGKVYGTTLAALTLQVYYRLLPTYQEKAVEAEEVEEKDDEDLIEVI